MGEGPLDAEHLLRLADDRDREARQCDGFARHYAAEAARLRLHAKGLRSLAEDLAPSLPNHVKEMKR